MMCCNVLRCFYTSFDKTIDGSGECMLPKGGSTGSTIKEL